MLDSYEKMTKQGFSKLSNNGHFSCTGISQFLTKTHQFEKKMCKWFMTQVNLDTLK